MASENEAKIKVFLWLFRKRRFYENRAPVEAKLLFFMFRASEKRLKIDANIDLEKNIEKKPQKSIFPSKLASQNLPKSLKIGSKSDVKGSSFRNAMDLARKSSEINGPQRL